MSLKNFLSFLVITISLSAHTSDEQECGPTIIDSSTDRYGNLSVTYADGSTFTWDRYGDIEWKSGDIQFSKDRVGQVKLSYGTKSYKKDRYGSSEARGLKEIDASKVSSYLDNLGKQAPLRTLASILGLDNKDSAQKIKAHPDAEGPHKGQSQPNTQTTSLKSEAKCAEQNSQNANNDGQCVMCLDDKVAEDKLLSCGHMILCRTCIKKLVDKNKPCPRGCANVKIIQILKE